MELLLFNFQNSSLDTSKCLAWWIKILPFFYRFFFLYIYKMQLFRACQIFYRQNFETKNFSLAGNDEQ